MGESWLGYTGIREDKRALWAHLFSSTSSSHELPSHELASIRREAGGLEEREEVLQAGESGAALRTRGGKSWRYCEKTSREKGTGSAMGCAHAHTGKEDYCSEKNPPERLNQGERLNCEMERFLKEQKRERGQT